MTSIRGEVYEDKRNEIENPLRQKCHFRGDERPHGADEGSAGLDRRGGGRCGLTTWGLAVEGGASPRHEPNHGTRHRLSSVSGRMSGFRHRFLAPRCIRDTSLCVSSAPMQGTPCAFSGWRRCRYAIRQPRRGKRPRPRHRQIPGSLRKIFILVLPRPGACHGVRPACPASVCCVHGPRLR